MRRPVHEDNTFRQDLRRSREDRRIRTEEDLRQYGGEILASEEIRDAYEQTHHLWSTVGEHTLRVAVASLAICYALKRLHIHTDVKDVVVGSLCHDLGILGREEKFENQHECTREHPEESVRVAEQLVPELSDRSRDIIQNHMWPLGGKRPTSMEGLIVSVADKYCSIKDLVKGSDRKHTGVRNTVQDARETARDTVREVRTNAQDAVQEARDTVEAVRQTVREAVQGKR
ncbi:MAG: HD domain-containing protein [Mogibacterium sp.]|nr:HD domain-containing protein [Mogibacterium sp.]